VDELALNDGRHAHALPLSRCCGPVVLIYHGCVGAVAY